MSLLIDKQVANSLNGKNTKSSLSQYLQGVQHFGITVDDMEKALEFYVGILGGK
ncbi:MAG: VOC family protein [Phormidium sp.]